MPCHDRQRRQSLKSPCGGAADPHSSLSRLVRKQWHTQVMIRPCTVFILILRGGSDCRVARRSRLPYHWTLSDDAARWRCDRALCPCGGPILTSAISFVSSMACGAAAGDCGGQRLSRRTQASVPVPRRLCGPACFAHLHYMSPMPDREHVPAGCWSIFSGAAACTVWGDFLNPFSSGSCQCCLALCRHSLHCKLVCVFSIILTNEGCAQPTFCSEPLTSPGPHAAANTLLPTTMGSSSACCTAGLPSACIRYLSPPQERLRNAPASRRPKAKNIRYGFAAVDCIAGYL